MQTHLTKQVLVYMFLLFLFGCTEEEFLNPSTEKEVTEQVIEPTNHSNGIVLKSLTFDEYPHQETVLNKLENIHKLRLNLNQTIVATDNTSSNPVLNGLSVIQEYSKYIEYPSGHHTYTFDTERESPNGRFENIVLVSNGQEGYDAFLVQYDVTEEEKKLILSGESTEDFLDKMTIVLLSYEDQINLMYQGNSVYYLFIGNCTLGVNIIKDNVSFWVSCVAPSDNSGDWDDYQGEGGSSGSGGSSGGFGGSPGSNSGGGSGTGTYSNPFATNPISAFDEALDDLRDCMAGDSGITPIFTTEQTDLMNNNLDFVNELLSICKGNPITGQEPVTDFWEAVDEVIKLQILSCLGLNTTQAQQDWINAQENAEFLDDLVNELNGCSTAGKEKVKRIIDLAIALEDNPYLLLDIPCDQLPLWQDVAQHQVPESNITKLENLENLSENTGPGWQVQYLDDAGGTIVNMDFFPVTITEFPTNPASGEPYTPEEFFHFFRLNLTDAADGSHWLLDSQFTPSNITGFDELQNWVGSTVDLVTGNVIYNPIDSIISIVIALDSGSVICSGYQHPNQQNGYWYFSTLTVPWLLNSDGDGFHPVSGHRKFGYYKTPGGVYVYYTRGVDRFCSIVDSALAFTMSGFENEFTGADNLWNTFQTNLKDYINNNGGNAIENEDRFYRPNYTKVRNYLNGTISLQDLGCN